jgi:hypothetical protein
MWWSPPTPSRPTPHATEFLVSACRSTTCWRSTPPVDPAGPLPAPARAAHARVGWQLRSRLRPHRATHSQGGLGQPLRLPAHRAGDPVTRKTGCCTPGGGGPSRSMRSPASRTPGQPCPPRRPHAGGTGASRRCTASAMSPSPRTPARSAPAPAQRHGDLVQPGHRSAPGRAGHLAATLRHGARNPARPLITLGYLG